MTWPASIPTATAGGVGAAADFNALRDALNAIGNAWTSYTPTLTGSTTDPSLGAGTAGGAYIQAGKFVVFRAVIIFGTGMSAGSGNYQVSLPVAASGTTNVHVPIGRASFLDASAPTVYTRTATLRTTAGTQVLLRDAAGAVITNTAPVVPASGDQIAISGFYESA